MVEQRLGRDAAPVQASAAKDGFAFDDERFQPPLAGANGGHVAPGSAPDDGQIVLRRISQKTPPNACRGARKMRLENRSRKSENRPLIPFPIFCFPFSRLSAHKTLTAPSLRENGKRVAVAARNALV